MKTPFDLIQALRSWFHAKDAEINTGGKDINTGGGDVIVGAGLVDGVNLTTHVADTDAHHNESHTVASHSDTTATGAELDDLTDGSDVTLHTHDTRYFQESEFSSNPGASSKPLESDGNGYLELEGIGVNDTPTANDIRAAADIVAGNSVFALADLRASVDLRAGGGIVVGSTSVDPPAGAIYLKEGAAPGTPTSGYVVIYAKTDGRVYSKDDTGTESGPL